MIAMELKKLVVSFTPFPELETGRFRLRRISSLDVNEVFALRSDPETMKYIPRPLAKTKEDALSFMDMIDKAIDNNLYIHWAISRKDDPKLIGMICLIGLEPDDYRAELGYILAPESRGQGVMHEASEAVINYAFKRLNFHSLQAIIAPENSTSERVLQRLNFVKEAHFRDRRYWNGQFFDDVVYSLIDS